MTNRVVQTSPIAGQKPGTSGLRKKTHVFMEPHYLENFVQSIWNAIGGAAGKIFVLGGDGRYFNERASQTVLRMAAANGAARVIVGRNALLSTPAASNLIRIRKTDGGVILSASHNPGGPKEDFGIKFNTPNGGPAPEGVTAKIFEQTETLSEYHIFDGGEIDLSVIGESQLGDMVVEVVDPVEVVGGVHRPDVDSFGCPYDEIVRVSAPQFLSGLLLPVRCRHGAPLDHP